MTWTKLSDDFSDDCRDLSDAAFRTHIEGLLWVMRRETGGAIRVRDVDRFAESEHARAAVDELVACGWWSIDRDGYRINHHMQHQPEPDLLAKRRELSASRQRRHRRKKAGLANEESASPSWPRPDPSRPDPSNASRNASRNAMTDQCEGCGWKTSGCTCVPSTERAVAGARYE